MKILLINPEKLIHPPFGLLYIASVLKAKGYEVKLMEISFGLTREERFNIAGMEIKRFGPNIVGITCMSMQAPISKDLVRDIKQRFENIKVIVGGVHPTVDSPDVLSWGTDISVRGEGEKTILDIIDFYNGNIEIESIKGISYRNEKGIFNNPDREYIKNLDELPPLLYNFLKGSRFIKRSYSIRGFWLKCGWIMTARGCPGRCIFCASKTMHGSRVREFGMERMLDEVERLTKECGIEGLWIFDDTFTLKERRVIEFCEGLNKQNIKLIWACQARVDTFTEGMAKAMKRAGCVQLDFGVESGSQKILDYVKKDIKCEDTRRAFKIAKDNGLRALATVMVGLPTENEKDLKMTEDLIKEIRPSFVAPFFATPYPGTELYRIAKENGWIDISKEIKWQQLEEPIMAVDMPHRDIKKAFEKLMSYNRSAIFDYLRQPRFLYDVLKIFIKYPKYFFKIALCVIRAEKKDLMNQFLYMFRKEMINNR